MALRGTLTHRKTRRLARLLNIPVPCALGVMEALWHVTGEQAPDGAIGRMSDDDIADEMFWDATSGEELVNALIAAALVDVDDEHRLVVHDWHEHADRHVKRKLVRNGQAMAGQRASMAAQMEPEAAQCPDMDASCAWPPAAAPEPEPEPVPEPEPEPEPEPACGEDEDPQAGRRSGPKRVPADWGERWDEFMAAYPPRDGDRKVAPARDKFRGLIASGVPPGELLAGVRRYRAFTDARGDTGTRFVQQITTWLNSKAWLEPWVITAQQQAGPARRGQLAPSTAADKREALRRELLEKQRAR